MVLCFVVLKHNILKRAWKLYGPVLCGSQTQYTEESVKTVWSCALWFSNTIYWEERENCMVLCFVVLKHNILKRVWKLYGPVLCGSQTQYTEESVKTVWSWALWFSNTIQWRDWECENCLGIRGKMRNFMIFSSFLRNVILRNKITKKQLKVNNFAFFSSNGLRKCKIFVNWFSVYAGNWPMWSPAWQLLF